MTRFLFFLLFSISYLSAGDWPQGSGPAFDYSSTGSAPTEWSAVQSKNIVWRKTLPETGQSTVVVSGGKAFFTTMEPVEADAKLGFNIEVWCVDANDGRTIWKRLVKGKHPLRLSGCFSDSSSPPPVTDGKLVVFVNASGMIAAFDFDGNEVWSRELLTVGRTQPFLYNGKLVTTRQIYAPEEGKFGHQHKEAPLADWTQLVALDFCHRRRQMGQPLRCEYGLCASTTEIVEWYACGSGWARGRTFSA